MNFFTKITVMLIAFNLITQALTREVTNEEIRDSILSLVHSYNLLDNKLERHEHRERALGELVKRALQSLQKGQKAYEPMNGIFSRLDERVSQIETILIAQEDKYNVQSDKLRESLENIFMWMKENSACRKPGSSDKMNDPKLDDKIDALSKNINDLIKSNENLLKQAEKLITAKDAPSDNILSKLEDKLTHFYVAESASAANNKNTELENTIKSHFNQILENIVALREASESANKLSKLDREFLKDLSNDTLHEINIMTKEVILSTDRNSNKDDEKAKILTEKLDHMNEVMTNLSNFNELTYKLFEDVNQSYFNLQGDFKVFEKFDKILLTTSDYVLDTQRKVEFGTYQVLQKVGEAIRLQNAELNKTLQNRFDDIDKSIVNNHLEALQNLSSTMESEISHVWRQIEIMHSEISYSKDALNKLQGQTDEYVNGTISTMDSLEGKVSQITGRMTEVDSNLNYLLGRLSLVTQEFNQIKTGLGKALDQIRNSFKTVQDKIKDVGPGPHTISNEEYETDINLLPEKDSRV